jgi:hypothetical protein
LIFGHPILAVSGLIVWIIYLTTDTDALRWVAFVILLAVATLGFTMVRCGAKSAPPARLPPASPAWTSRPSSTSPWP